MAAKRTLSRRPTFFLAVLSLAALAGPASATDIAPLLAKAGAAARAGDSAAGVDALEQALAALRLEAPLTLKSVMAVTRPAAHFGDYEKRPDLVFAKGEALNFYMEPRNLVATRNAAGVYEPGFEVDLEVVTAEGKSIAKLPRFASLRVPTRTPVQDVFMNLKVTLSGVPAGGYGIRFLVRDLNSKKTAAGEQRITIK